VATDDLTHLAAMTERHTGTDGAYDTAVPGLTLFRSSEPSDHDAIVYVPSLVIVTQGARAVQRPRGGGLRRVVRGRPAGSGR
jgi:hypothetical protein